ncbi:hypothetical protein GUJ93_ZPchr0012g21906 [Zizania palustris]|uniref:Uncharacterized protein n=1 Tax=Zizania palustris TaxID=103762 RepID=A0A8J6BSP8_ZIZPA|nr:hypothetical protein GUJ93_ZPchr0012g21906 [Zizania palustris]
MLLGNLARPPGAARGDIGRGARIFAFYGTGPDDPTAASICSGVSVSPAAEWPSSPEHRRRRAGEAGRRGAMIFK